MAAGSGGKSADLRCPRGATKERLRPRPPEHLCPAQTSQDAPRPRQQRRGMGLFFKGRIPVGVLASRERRADRTQIAARAAGSDGSVSAEPSDGQEIRGACAPVCPSVDTSIRPVIDT